jgi:hypothetical protein
MAYRKADGWYLSAPGDSSEKVTPPKLLKVDHDAQLAVAVFLDAKGRAQAKAYNWHEHGTARRFCVQ